MNYKPAFPTGGDGESGAGGADAGGHHGPLAHLAPVLKQLTFPGSLKRELTFLGLLLIIILRDCRP